jgi:hypothetical protein
MRVPLLYVRERAVPPGAVRFFYAEQRLVGAVLLDTEGEQTNAKRVLPAAEYREEAEARPDSRRRIGGGLSFAHNRFRIGEPEAGTAREEPTQKSPPYATRPPCCESSEHELQRKRDQ